MILSDPFRTVDAVARRDIHETVARTYIGMIDELFGMRYGK
jgi:hypothetical protein